MVTDNDMSDVARYKKKVEKFVGEVDLQNFLLAANLRKSRETEHKLCAFICTKVRMNFCQFMGLFKCLISPNDFLIKCSAQNWGVMWMSGTCS